MMKCVVGRGNRMLGEAGDCFFFRQGEDLVVTKPDGQFVSMFPGTGISWFKGVQVFH